MTRYSEPNTRTLMLMLLWIVVNCAQHCTAVNCIEQWAVSNEHHIELSLHIQQCSCQIRRRASIDHTQNSNALASIQFYCTEFTKSIRKRITSIQVISNNHCLHDLDQLKLNLNISTASIHHHVTSELIITWTSGNNNILILNHFAHLFVMNLWACVLYTLCVIWCWLIQWFKSKSVFSFRNLLFHFVLLLVALDNKFFQWKHED